MGGAEKLMVDLLPRLRDKGVDVELAIFDGRVTPLYKELALKDIKIHRFMEGGGNVYSPINLFKLLNLIRKGKYDIIHTHNTAPQLFAAVASLFGSANYYTTEHNTSNRRRKMRWFKPIDKWMYSRYNKVICISKKAEQNLLDHLKQTKAKIFTINNGVDVSKYISAAPSDELNLIAPGSRKIIMVAAFRWEKDQDTLIRALSLLPEQFHLFLVGDGVRRIELVTIAMDENVLDRVHFMGIRNDVPHLLRSVDYIVMSSHFEGLSLSSVEGMSVRKPFIASNVDGLREVVEGAGLLFPHQDAKALADIIMDLESNETKYKSIANACFERAKQFDISIMSDSYDQCYQEFLNIQCK